MDKERTWRFQGALKVIEWNLSPGVLGSQVLLGMCRWLLRTPAPLQSFLWPTIDPILVTFWANVIVISKTEFNANRLLNIKTTAGTIF